jgi:molybdenum cofactor synthesis domain-containing protein
MRDSKALLLPDAAALPRRGPDPVRGFVTAEMLAPEQAIVAFFARAKISPPGVEHVLLDDAFGRILAQEATAREDHPSHPRSTLDGFAVASADGAAPRRLVGDVRMGHAPARGIGPGEAMRIPTGGALPDGADAVVAAEDVAESDGTIVLSSGATAGDAVTPRASDIRVGEVALRRGRRIGGPELGVLATLGITEVPVYRRPRFGVVSTGDELVDASVRPGIGQVRDSNRYAVAGALRAMGANVAHFPRAADEAGPLRELLEAMLQDCDAIVLTGGSSVGARDVVPRVVASLGEPGVIVHGIRLKPGKPTMFAAIGDTPVIGLPGNPTSSLTVLEAVARPIVAACTGERDARPDTIEAVADEAFVGRDGWTWFIPAQVRSVHGRLLARPLRIHSAHVSPPARATGYATVGEYPSRVERGAPIRVYRYSAGGAPVFEAQE